MSNKSNRAQSVKSTSSVASSLKRMIPSFKRKAPRTSAPKQTSAIKTAAEEVISEAKADKTKEDKIEEEEAETETKLTEVVHDYTVDKSSGSKLRPTTENTSISKPTPTSRTAAPTVSAALPYIYEKYKDSGLYAVRNLKVSNYIPNDIALSFKIDAVHRIMTGNKYLKKSHPNYLPMAATLYMAIIKQLRVFQVRQAHGMNSTAGTQLLTRFERALNLKIDDLPIPNVFRQDIESVAAYKPNNGQISWLMPFLPDNLGGDAATDIHNLNLVLSTGARPATSISGSTLLSCLFSIPVLHDWLRYYVTADFSATATVTAAVGQTPAVTKLSHEDKNSFVPFPLNLAANETIRPTLAGFTITQAAATAAPSQWRYLTALGTTNRNGNDFEDLKLKQNYWKTSSYANFTHKHNVDADLSTPQLYMGFGQSFLWIHDLIDNISVISKYMGGHCTLGELDINGSGSCTIFNKVECNPGNVLPRIFGTNHPFYTPLITHADSLVQVYEDDLPSRYVALSKYTLTNARINMRYIIDTDGQNTNVTLVPMLNQASGARTGPFFNNEVKKVTAAADPSIEEAGPFSTLLAESHPCAVLDGYTDFIRAVYYTPEL